jgi:hypothetical protein
MKDRRPEPRESEQAAATASTSRREELRGYEQLKFSLAEVIREIMAVARECRAQHVPCKGG